MSYPFQKVLFYNSPRAQLLITASTTLFGFDLNTLTNILVTACVMDVTK